MLLRWVVARDLLFPQLSFQIFGTDENLQILCEAERIFIDGTFKIVPALFHQLYTVHAKYKGQVFPLIFALLQSQSQFHYESMWRLIMQAATNQGRTLNLRAAISDFEASAINAVRTIFPAADVKGCYFHYAQSVMRKVSI